MRVAAAVLVSAVTMYPAFAADPAQALSEARARLAGGDCRAAAATLERAFPDARAIADEKTRQNALAALHFYSAVAFSDCRDAGRAREELQAFFELKPGQNAVDSTKYSREFVRLFEQAQSRSVDGASFERFYAVMASQPAPEPLPLVLWGASTEFILFGSEDEKSEWGRLQTDAERNAFVERFWSRRDGTASDAENAWRTQLLGRIAFADRVFTGSDRGSMSDRGRVFVLLGEPARVHRRAMRQYATTLPLRTSRAATTGVYERWVYFKPQLPDGVPAREVVFTFITDDYGATVLQRDFMPMRVLNAAKNVNLQK